MPTPEQMQDGWAAERILGLRPEDYYGDEHFHPDSDVIRERRIREEQLRRDLDENPGEVIGHFIYDFGKGTVTFVPKNYLDFENLCYFK